MFWTFNNLMINSGAINHGVMQSLQLEEKTQGDNATEQNEG